VVKRIAALLVFVPLGCSPTPINVEIGLLFPEDDQRLAATDNVSVTLTPDGFSDTFATDGPDFSLEVELEPDDTERELAVFMARGESLIAYGRTPPFAFRVASGVGVQVLLAYPESLATLPLSFDLPDASTLAAPAVGRGMVALGGDGTTAFLDRFTFDLEFAAALDDPPAGDDGTMVGDSAGNVVRVAWNERLSAHRFDVALDQWRLLGTGEGTRAGAVSMRLGDDALLLLGGEGRTDALQVSWSAEEDGEATFEAGPAWALLDAPRPGARALALPFPDGPRPLLVGGDDPALPRVLPAWGGAAAVGPAEAWTGLQCVQLDTAGADATAHLVLCAGGIRADEPTADALFVSVDAAGAAEVTELPTLLPAPMADVLWLADDAAVYAQGDGRWVRIDRSDLVVTEPPAASARARGGCTVPLDTGITLIVGGIDQAGAPTSTWQVFAPALP
jgi:hypothetical protein